MFPFESHLELLRSFIGARAEIVERIEQLLNVERKPVEFRRNGPALTQYFESCFYRTKSLRTEQSQLRGALEAAHWAAGFKPRVIPGVHNDVIDPAEMMRRAFYLWEQTRWPARVGRVRYAHTLFDLYLLRQLMLLSMRVWDLGSERASELLTHVQRVLDELWSAGADSASSGARDGQLAFVRDARWLIPVAQSPATDELAPYFDVAAQIADTLANEDRLETLKATVQMAAGHLRSYLRYYMTQKAGAQNELELDDHRLVLIARKSNALDFSQLIQGLVPLLGAYERAVGNGDAERRLALADAICQAISPDPELFVNRVDVLGAYSMVEQFFTTTDDDGHVIYTPTGARQALLLERYATLIAGAAKPLFEDCARFRPVAGEYSPYAILYGVSSNLLEHMTLKTLTPDADTRFGLEDVFTSGDAAKLAWADGWRKLPHVKPEVQKLYEYPQQFAEQIFERIERALRTRAGRVEDDPLAPRTGRLFVVAEANPSGASGAHGVADLPARYIRSSDAQLVAARKASAMDKGALLRDRLEGHFIVAFETAGGWTALDKDLLTDVLLAGHDAKIAGLPRAAVEALRLLCPSLIEPSM